MERADIGHWSAKDVARLLALLEAQLGYYREIAAALPIPLAVVSKDRSVLWTNRAFRKRFGTRVPDRGFTEIPLRAWHDEDETETLLVLRTPPQALATQAGGVPGDLPAIVWQADAATLEFRSVEGGVEAIFGHPASYWLSHPEFFEERIHPDDRAATMALYRGVLSAGGEASAEYRTTSAAGGAADKNVWCRETIRVTGATVTGVITNITARKQLERQLLSAGRFEALYGFAGRLAHDLNNPLMIVTGYAEELMQALKPSDPLRQEASEILGAARRIGWHRRATDRVRPAAGQAGVESEYRRLDPEFAIETHRRRRSRRTRRRGADGEPPTGGGHGRSGAAGRGAHGGRRRRAKEHAAGTDAHRHRVGRRDGGGAPVAHCLGRRQVRSHHRSRRWAWIGCGSSCGRVRSGAQQDRRSGVRRPPRLALARAYSFVHEWGGDIAFASEPGQGSTFSIYLPYVEPEGAPVVRPAARRTVPGEPATILVVDDEAGIRELIRKILLRERYRVLEAGSAEEAVDDRRRGNRSIC